MSAFNAPITASIVSLTIQFFFVHHILILSGMSSWFLCLIICVSSTLGAVATFYGGVYTRLSGNTLSNIIIAGSMIFHSICTDFLLLFHRKDSNFSDHVLSRIVRLTIETNVSTTTVGIISLQMVAIFPVGQALVRLPNCYPAILGNCAGAGISNTLLVSLNNRISIHDRRRTIVRSPPLTFALTTNSQPTSEALHVDLKKPSRYCVIESLFWDWLGTISRITTLGALLTWTEM
ncbi:hypothetical protein BJY52DRAFT_1224998 [Lactarius psammicola]|nr:hypothetical protein BJY52DRAFT_1224998 [Lactarius psammicola]